MRCDNEVIVQLLLGSGALDPAVDHSGGLGAEALIMAAGAARVNVAKTLLEKGASVVSTDARGEGGRTPAMSVAECWSGSMAEALLRAGWWGQVRPLPLCRQALLRRRRDVPGARDERGRREGGFAADCGGDKEGFRAHGRRAAQDGGDVEL